MGCSAAADEDGGEDEPLGWKPLAAARVSP